jgi:hypothetical protein
MAGGRRAARHTSRPRALRGKGGQAVREDQQFAEARVKQGYDPHGGRGVGPHAPPDKDGDRQADHVGRGVTEARTGAGQPAAEPREVDGQREQVPLDAVGLRGGGGDGAGEQAAVQQRARWHLEGVGEDDQTAEIDVEGREHLHGGRGVRLSDVHRGVMKRREQLGGSLPALTTISTQLRTLKSKGLIRETTIGAAADEPERKRRGMLTPTTRSPLTGYRTAYPPEVVLGPTFRELATAFPAGHRAACVLRCVLASGYDQKTAAAVAQVLRLADVAARRGGPTNRKYGAFPSVAADFQSAGTGKAELCRHVGTRPRRERGGRRTSRRADRPVFSPPWRSLTPAAP